MQTHGHTQAEHTGHAKLRLEPSFGFKAHKLLQRPLRRTEELLVLQHSRGRLERHTAEEILRIEPWGPHAVRVRASSGTVDPAAPGALDSPSPSPHAELSVADDGCARLVNGRLAVEASVNGRLRFLHADSGRELLADKTPYPHHPGPRVHAAGGRTEQRFAAYDDEKLYGLGQHQHGLLDQKGVVLDLVQRNAEVAIPVLTSSRGYALLWNNPAIGRVELAGNGTRWVADSARQIDYWITAGHPGRRSARATAR